jgi:hypothetical protein
MEMCVPRKFKIEELLLDRMHPVLEVEQAACTKEMMTMALERDVE